MKIDLIYEFLLCGMDTTLIFLMFLLIAKPFRSLSVLISSSVVITFVSFFITNQVNSATFIMILIAVGTYTFYAWFVFKIKLQTVILYNFMFQISSGIVTLLVIDGYISYYHNSIESLMYFGLSRVIVTLIIKLILLSYVILLSKIFTKIKNNIPNMYFWGFLFLLNTSLVTISELHRILSNQFDGFLFLTLLITIIISGEYILLLSLAKMLQNKSREEILLMNNHMMEKHLNLLQQDESKILKLKHDIKNQLVIIQFLISSDSIDKSQLLLTELNSKLDKSGISINTGNVFADTIINYKIHQFSDIKFKFDCQIEKEISIQSLDFTSLLVNLIDNSVEATQKTDKKNVEVTLKETSSNYFIMTKNSCSQNPIESNFKSKKQNGHQGYGIRIIQEIVTKYCGEIFYIYEEGQLTIRIILNKQIDSNEKITTHTETV